MMELAYCLVLLSAITLLRAMTTPETRDTTMAYNQPMTTMNGSTNTTNAITLSPATTMSMTRDTTMANDQSTTTMNGSTNTLNESTNSTRAYMYTVTSTIGLNCSYPGQECRNGTCSSAGTCNCDPDFKGAYCEIYQHCLDNYCDDKGSANCTVMDTGKYNCTCNQGYSGNLCREHNGCQSSPCHNNGTCDSQDKYGGYKCSCTTGDPALDCLLNEQNDCNLAPPNSVGSYITCLDLIGSHMLYCRPGFNESGCRTQTPDNNYCVDHGCLKSTYCKPLCNVQICNETDVCRNFTALAPSNLTLKYDHTECRLKFANGYTEGECSEETGLYDGYDSQREHLQDCNPFFNTICTSKFSDGACDKQCNNTDCLYDGGDCMSMPTNSIGSPSGITVIRFSQARNNHTKQIMTKLSLFARSVLQIQFSRDGLQAGLKFLDSNFTTIAVASKFIAVGIGKLPGLVDFVADVYTCEHGKKRNGGMTCDTNCSSTCIQSGDICDWSNGSCLMGCQNNHWGDQCQNLCNPVCNGTCNQKDGSCLQCPTGTYGAICNMTCDQYCVSSECNIKTGLCNCIAGHYLSNSKCMNCSDGCNSTTCDDGDGHCSCLPGYYGDSCMDSCSPHCKGMVCSVFGICTSGCEPGYHGKLCTCAAGHYFSNSKCMNCSDGCSNTTCDDGDGHCSCLPGYYGDSCMDSCSPNCKGMVCSVDGVCTSGCKPGYHGPSCKGMCPKGCNQCNRDTGKCIGPDSDDQMSAEEPEENNTGVVIAIFVAIFIVFIIILIAVLCWKRKQSGDYIVEDEEMECPVKKADTMEVKRNMDLQPVSLYMGGSTDMIELDEKQAAVVYAGPKSVTNTDLVDRNPDGKSTKSDDSGSSSENEKKKSAPDDDGPATGVGAPMGRKKSSLKITLSREKTPSGEMSPTSPHLLVFNDKTGEILSPLKVDGPDQIVFVMPVSPLKSTMAPLASEEDLLSAVGPKQTTPTIEEDQPPVFSPPEPPIDKEDKTSRKSSSSSDGKGSKRSSRSSAGKRSKKSKSSSSSSSSSDMDDPEKVSEYAENKEPLTEM